MNSIRQNFKSLLALSLLIFVTSIYAQNVNVDFTSERAIASRNISPKVTANGSPYINEIYLPIKISQYPSKIFSARYNAYNGEMEVKINEEKIIALDNTAEYKVIFTGTNKTYVVQDYITSDGMSKRGFLVVIDSKEKYTLFKEERVKFYEKVTAATSYQQDKPAKFKKESDRFYLKKGSKVVFIPQKKKDLIKLFPEVKSYMKKNNLNPKNEEDLIKLIQYSQQL